MLAKLLTGVFFICLFFSCSLFNRTAKINTGPEVMTFAADLGPVLFNHRRHQKNLKQDCAICHHKGSEKNKACRSCHKKKKNTLEGDPICFFDVKLSLCRGCHQRERDQEISKTAPIHCSECHDTKKIKWSK
jgi:hypothetical protein